MSDPASADLLERYQGPQREAAAEELFRRYLEKLTALARSRLSRALASRVDAEDVVQSAYRSFFLLVGNGDVVVQESGDLWRLLARIALRKGYRSARRHRADCRSVDREHPDAEQTGEIALSRDPTPADAAALADELRCLVAPLDVRQRRIVEMRLQGHDVESIAGDVQRSTKTIRRVLAAFGAELQRRLGDELPRLEEGLIGYREVMLHQQLGQGGMGKVYRASWRGSEKPVAVKLLRKQLRGHAAIAARFREETRILAQLRHPGIVAIYGVGQLPDGGHFLVMELVEGGDLASAPSPKVDVALRWVAEAADAIEYAHGKGVVHCDIKPSNLMLGADGHVRVSDFGLARCVSSGDGPKGGTAGFMAPEQIDPDGIVTPRTDVYCLGAVLRALVRERPAEVDVVCSRCLSTDPADRYASAAELAVELRSLLAKLAIQPFQG